jgi:SsrA-binding protein
MKVVCSNRKAKKNYHIDETMEAGISLVGTEVKSLRAGMAHLQDAYAAIEDGELFLHNAHISPYEKGNIYNHEPKRTRKLLMHKKEIRRLYGKVQQKGYTLVPLSFYFNDAGIVKVELGLARGKKAYDKRREIAERDARRDMQREAKYRDY